MQYCLIIFTRLQSAFFGRVDMAEYRSYMYDIAEFILTIPEYEPPESPHACAKSVVDKSHINRRYCMEIDDGDDARFAASPHVPDAVSARFRTTAFAQALDKPIRSEQRCTI